MGQRKIERRPLFYLAFSPDSASMSVDDALDSSKADPVIFDIIYVPVILGGAARFNMRCVMVLREFDGISKEIGTHLLNERPVSASVRHTVDGQGHVPFGID